MTNFRELVDASLYKDTLDEEVAEVVAELTGAPHPDNANNLVKVGFLTVGVRPDANRQVFIEFMADKLRPGRGSFTNFTMDELSNGQSYISIGAWLGDQRDALILMAIGAHHDAWDIMTPETLGIPNDSDEGKQMMGSGFVYTGSVKPQVRADIEAEQAAVDKQNGVTK